MGTWYFHAYPKASPTYGAHHAKGISDAQAIGITSNDSTPSALFGRTWSVGNIAGSGGYIIFPGAYNLPTTRARTYHIRVRPKYSTAPTGAGFGIFGLVGIYQLSGNFNHGLGIYHGTDGVVRLHVGSNQAGFGQILSNVNMGTWNPTAGVAYDIQLVWDGTTTANSFKIYINGSLLGQATPSQAWVEPVQTFFQQILLGQSTITTATGFDFEEIAIGSGADFTLTGFTGASRTTNLINLPALQGISWPMVANTQDNQTWNEFGVTKVGTLAVTESTDPGIENVAKDIEYKINDVDLVGTLFLGAFYDTLRGFLNYILDFIGSTSLTNDEFNSLTLVNPEFEYNLETYNALLSVLDSREDLSDARDRLKSMFEATGLVIDTPSPTENESDILFGGGVEDSDTETGGYTNVLYGGSIED